MCSSLRGRAARSFLVKLSQDEAAAWLNCFVFACRNRKAVAVLGMFAVRFEA